MLVYCQSDHLFKFQSIIVYCFLKLLPTVFGYRIKHQRPTNRQ